MPDQAPPEQSSTAKSMDAKALLLGERIDTRGFEPEETISKTPLAFRAGGGVVVVYRFGAVAFIGVAQDKQEEILAALHPRVVEPAQPVEFETAVLAADGESEDTITVSGRISLLDLSDARLLVVANVLAKSVALADDERYMRKVVEQIEPFAQNLAAKGHTGLTSRRMLQLVGESLVAQGRMIGRVEVQEQPDLLWDRPNLQRLYARLAEEYELEDRARALARKLKVIEETARTLADYTDTRHGLRLEAAIVALIVFEILLTFYNMWTGAPH
jgi:uncharacterized Rmd1/YagE family protein